MAILLIPMGIVISYSTFIHAYLSYKLYKYGTELEGEVVGNIPERIYVGRRFPDIHAHKIILSSPSHIQHNVTCLTLAETVNLAPIISHSTISPHSQIDHDLLCQTLAYSVKIDSISTFYGYIDTTYVSEIGLKETEEEKLLIKRYNNYKSRTYALVQRDELPLGHKIKFWFYGDGEHRITRRERTFEIKFFLDFFISAIILTIGCISPTTWFRDHHNANVARIMKDRSRQQQDTP